MNRINPITSNVMSPMLTPAVHEYSFAASSTIILWVGRRNNCI